MDREYDVIIFFGPPFAGKSAYFKHMLHSTHQRLSATELFKENPDFGLRQVILKITSLLREGKKVVIDDENWMKATRTSYVKSVSAKFPNCKFLCLKFNPEELIPYWSMEWALAEKVLQHDLSHTPFDLRKAEAKINYWYGKNSGETCGLKLDEPIPGAGFDVKVVQTKLMAEIEYKFEVPALLLQWQAITVTSNKTLQFLPGTEDVINCWIKSNPWGRVIITMDGFGNKIDSSNSESSQELAPDTWKSLLCSLCKAISIPIYVIQLQTTSSTTKFSRPPQSGILAFLQRLHHLHLFHKHTLYLHCTHDHSKMAEEAGVRHAVADNVLHNPQIVVKPRCSTKVAVKSELKNIEFKQRVEGQRSLPEIPLYDEAKECNVDSDWGYFEETLPGEYMHGVCFKDVDTVERYQQLYAETASRISDPGTKMVSQQHHVPEKALHPTPQSSMQSSTTSAEKPESHTAATQANKVLPSWLLPKSQRHKKSTDDSLFGPAPSPGSSVEEEVSVRRKKSNTQPSTVYCMNVLELLETAQLVLKESGESDSLIADLINTSPDVKTKKLDVADSLNTKEDGDTEEEKHPCSSPEAENISNKKQTCDLDDVFLSREETFIGRPPPKKKRTSNSATQNEPDQQSHEDSDTSMTSKSKEQQQNVQVPETITTIPETEGCQSSSVSKESLQMSGLSRGGKTTGTNERKRTQPSKPGPDLSFLDDIF